MGEIYLHAYTAHVLKLQKIEESKTVASTPMMMMAELNSFSSPSMNCKPGIRVRHVKIECKINTVQFPPKPAVTVGYTHWDKIDCICFRWFRVTLIEAGFIGKEE